MGLTAGAPRSLGSSSWTGSPRKCPRSCPWRGPGLLPASWMGGRGTPLGPPRPRRLWGPSFPYPDSVTACAGPPALGTPLPWGDTRPWGPPALFLDLPACLSIYICLFVYLSVFLFIYLSVYVSTYLPVYLSAFYLLVYLSTCLSALLCVCLSIYLAIYLPTYLPTWLPGYLPTYMLICLPAHLSIYLPICLSTCLSIYLPICLSTSPSLSIHPPWTLALGLLHTVLQGAKGAQGADASSVETFHFLSFPPRGGSAGSRGNSIFNRIHFNRIFEDVHACSGVPAWVPVTTGSARGVLPPHVLAHACDFLSFGRQAFGREWGGVSLWVGLVSPC